MADRFSDLIGVPFAYGGRGPDAYDCYGLLRKLYADDGVEIPDYLSPTDGARITALMLGQVHLWRELSKPHPGCAILFRIPGNMHVAYYIGDDWFIHTWEGSGGVTKERLSQWRHRVVGFYEYVG